LAVAFEGGHGVTRDVSASGLYFETDSPCTLGGAISFSVNFDSPAGKMALKCRGRVVRVERNEGRMGVAVNVVESMIEVVEGGAVR
jgi:acyl-coenzyme A thioesterase PaaI-like protein